MKSGGAIVGTQSVGSQTPPPPAPPLLQYSFACSPSRTKSEVAAQILPSWGPRDSYSPFKQGTKNFRCLWRQPISPFWLLQWSGPLKHFGPPKGGGGGGGGGGSGTAPGRPPSGKLVPRWQPTNQPERHCSNFSGRGPHSPSNPHKCILLPVTQRNAPNNVAQSGNSVLPESFQMG